MAAAVFGLAAAMIVSVRRGAEVRLLSGSLADLGRKEMLVRARLARAMVRVDSLGSRERILSVAAPLGLRLPREREIVFLRDVEELDTSSGPGAGL